MPDRFSPIGVFDSGVGGVSVLGELARTLPYEDFLYYGDNLHAPYGTKPEAEVLGYVRGVMDHLIARDVKAVVIACNTATSVAAAALRSELALPIIGMEPALKPAAEQRRGGQILVLATPMTLRLPKFQALYARYGEGAVPLPCPGLMELVETQAFDQARRYLLEHFLAYDMSTVDAVVLGCTHYVFLRPILQEILPPHVLILDGNAGTARQLARVLEQRDLLNRTGGSIRLETSGDSASVLPLMHQLLARA
ncbi:MAG: glutamate racemase [Clostridiales bacterium]|nr:glutamate racemase [Clostridiales bacterium]